ncbi:MAG: peptidyl-prolyl cis-trans isomerase, partial [Gammaproteobacteria bacterium]|nr:peptidyl-prolyl cis-trans isomerase [Gammaproteobacteria bacterium]
LFNTLQQIDAFKEDGKFSKKAYEMALNQSGEPSSSFEARIRRALLADQIVKGIASTAIVTKGSVENTYSLEKQERELAYVRIAADDFKKTLKISDEDIKAHYETNRESYKTQEKVDLEYLELTINDLTSGVDATTEELEEYYEEQKDRFSVKEERKARHILIEGDSADSRQKAQSLYEQIVGGADFGKLAKENSADPGSAADGGMLDFFSKGMMDPAFEDAAYSLSKGEISKPVLSEFGYHIIKLEEVRGGQTKPFEEVKAQLENDLKRQKAEKIYFDKVEKLTNMAYEMPDTLSPAAEELGLTLKTTGLFGRAGGPGIAANRKVQQAAFSEDVMRERLNSEVIELGDNHAVVVRLKEYQGAEVRPLEQVKTRIENELKTKGAKDKAKEKGEAIVAKVNAGNMLKNIAEAEKLEVTGKAWVKRDDSKLGPEISREVFSTQRPADENGFTHGVSLNNGDYVVMTLFAVKDGDISALTDSEKTEIANRLANATGVDEFGFALNSYKDKAEIKRYPGNL